MIKLEIKPMSVNKCWQGKRFKSREYRDYEHDVFLLLSILKPERLLIGAIEIDYKFYLKSIWMSDLDNFAKPLTDILVKAQIIPDDRYIAKMTLEKIKSKTDYIEISIKSFNVKK